MRSLAIRSDVRRGARPGRAGRGRAGSARARGGTMLGAWLAALLALPAPGLAQSITNSVGGTAGGVALDVTRATVTLTRQLVPGVPSVAEVTPNRVPPMAVGSVLTFDLLPAVQSGGPVVDQLTLTAPPGYSAISVLSVSVG